MDKNALRRRFLEERQALSAARRQELSARVVGHLEKWLAARAADVVGLYYAVKGEPDVLALARSSAASAFALPVVGEKPGAMVFHTFQFKDDLKKSRLGVMEPLVTAPVTKLTASSVVIVPAVALDRTGARLGYGGGYYDRFLEEFPGTAIGVVFRSMMVASLPVLPHDRHLPFAVTEEGVTVSVAP